MLSTQGIDMATDSTGDVVEERYVAFCDILGFSSSVATDFNKTLTIYRQFGDLMSGAPFNRSDVNLTMYSDSILVTGLNLELVIQAVQSLWFIALASDLMIRGGVARGRYWEKRQGNDLLVVSDALVRAVKIEKLVSVPAVVLADDIEVPDSLWLRQFLPSGDGILNTPVLHFRDRNIVNPFNPMWLLSAGRRAEQLMEASPGYMDKYLWFLALHSAVTSRRALVPPEVYARFVREEIIVPVPPEEIGD